MPPRQACRYNREASSAPPAAVVGLNYVGDKHVRVKQGVAVTGRAVLERGRDEPATPHGAVAAQTAA